MKFSVVGLAAAVSPKISGDLYQKVTFVPTINMYGAAHSNSADIQELLMTSMYLVLHKVMDPARSKCVCERGVY